MFANGLQTKPASQNYKKIGKILCLVRENPYICITIVSKFAT
ncbi:hypothetical protein HMPREF1991_03103 [Hoylesella loescheii DSM 19665 = JCM 12249 = ATCC 15930]|uniref:Uncharacterized protein n=1 Tax=Hoylesella loescheii DSM 19665 = JCM 12249 = ATCC 15930 TaxID=1122985 RepID=A0A069QDW9_HOYLO|nr:hypothetical protein HMPREF1991_03103 [Hoylesella loescheii DSM 19665 = JCM 12249 = ATCC 15930]